MLFLLLAFMPRPHEVAAALRSLIKPKAAFFLLWALVFVVSHLWNFRKAPWNGNGLFIDSAVDLWFLKGYVIGHPFQAAWYHVGFLISRETLFHYYVWGFLKLFGFNILSYEAALLVLWCAAFTFTLLLVDLLFRSNTVTSVTALIFNFLPLAFIYTFVGYRYPMTIALCVGSLYFLHLGFRHGSPLHLSLGGVMAGLCLASSMLGKQYLLALAFCALLYAGLHWKTLRQSVKWRSVVIVVYGFAVAAVPILCYIVFNWQAYAHYEGTFIHSFQEAVRGHPSPNDITYYVTQLWRLFFSVPGPRLFFPNLLPIPLPYYFFLLPGIVLALLKKRFEIVLLAAIPVVGVFISGGGVLEHRLLLAIPFWIILISFTLAGLLKLRPWPGLHIVVGVLAGLILLKGLGPSIRYIYNTTNNHYLSMAHWRQGEVAVSRFLRNVVAGREPSNPPRLEHDEFNRIAAISDPPYDTLICQTLAYAELHLFLHDYDDQKILSFCGGQPMFVFVTDQDVWRDNKRAIVEYVPSGKDLKLIWERGSKTDRIIKTLEPAREHGTEESISFSFSGKTWNFYVLNIGSKNITAFQERVRDMPDLGPTPMPLQPTAKIGPTPAAASGGWTFCANETKQCNFSGTKQVRYGANGIYTYGTFHDGVVCSNAAFGSDPLFGVIKHCDYADISTPTPTPTPRSRQRSQ
jgi:hypothetical protein